MIYSNFSKIDNFQRISFFFSYIFLILAKNLACGYTLEPPRRVPTIYILEQRKIGIPLNTPVLPQFYYKKVGFKGVFIARTCFPGVLHVRHTCTYNKGNLTVLFTPHYITFLDSKIEVNWPIFSYL